jgi:hypothetical protein
VWMKGRPLSTEHREKIRQALNGRKLPPEVMEKRKMVTPPIRISKKPPPVVDRWIEKLRMAVRVRRRYHVRASEDSLAIFAGYLTLLGPPGEGESEINTVYADLLTFLLSWRRWQHLPQNLRLLPADPAALTKIAAVVKASWKIENAENASFPEAAFVTTALKLQDPVAYVEVCMREGHKFIRSAFAPGTYDHIGRKYRGVVGDLADVEYRKQIREKLKTIT